MLDCGQDEMDTSLEEALRAALDDEYHARATYRAVLDAFGDLRPFINMVESEERHIQALKRQVERHGIAVPNDNWAGRVAAPESLERAFEDAVKAEHENAVLYEKLAATASRRVSLSKIEPSSATRKG